MKERRLNKSGSTSYTVSLPIEWVRMNGLTSKDPLYLAEEGDAILVRCKAKDPAVKHLPIINANTSGRRTLIERVRQQYNADATEIIFTYKDTRDLSTISAAMERFPGFEMHTQDDHRVVYTYLFDRELIDERQILRKMDLMVRTVLREFLGVFDNHGNHPDLTTPRRQIDDLRKQGRLLERQVLRKPHLTKERLAILLAGKSFLKTGALFSEFIEMLAVLDEHQMREVVKPAVLRFRKLYEATTGAFFTGQDEEILALKEMALEEIDRMDNELLGASDVLLALSMTTLKNVLHELVRIMETGALATEQ